MTLMQTMFVVVFFSLPLATLAGVLFLLAAAAVRRLRGVDADAPAKTATSHA